MVVLNRYRYERYKKKPIVLIHGPLQMPHLLVAVSSSMDNISKLTNLTIPKERQTPSFQHPIQRKKTVMINENQHKFPTI